jgi:hypothetical protein
MGFLLKIAILAVVVYGAWTTVRRWTSILGGGQPKAAAGSARGAAAGAAPARGRRDAALPDLYRLRVGRRCKMRPARLSPARLTGRGSVPILPHRKNGLKWRKYKAF